MLNKVLIANRGEIAVRIIRACAEMGITSVAIYSETDCYALHVKAADEAYCIGPESVAAYLNYHRIVDIAVATKCDAIHPGYGFLSENAQFAQACADNHIIFIGPSPQTIATMGSKVAARAAMKTAGLPVIPGSEGNVDSIDEAKQIAAQIGYPVMLKATAGGGGRGIRQCNDERELENNYPRVKSEAEKAFGDTAVYVEKVIVRPRHIEVQILGDHQGNVIHLFERDCSIQRRHQKLVEIAPSPQISQTLREKITAMAVQAAKQLGYVNAGTVEFMVDEEENAYFLEVNTRLQVEHPITEAITGIDIVQSQLCIADQQPLPMKQADIHYRGYAIEFRINAEDPQNDFLPSFGKITKYYAPGGPGVRTDSAIYTGYVIPPDYDSLCAKVTVWALDWQGVLMRSKRVLEELRMRGVKTTTPYYLQIINDEDFKNANFTTDFIETHPQLLNYSERSLPHHRATVIAAALSALRGYA